MNRLIKISLWFILLFFSITMSVNATQLIVNGTFDDNLTGWVITSGTVGTSNFGSQFTGMNGDFASIGQGFNEKSTMEQTFMVSAGHTSLTIDFDWYVMSNYATSSVDSSIWWRFGENPFSQELLISNDYINQLAYGHVTYFIDTEQWTVDAETKLEFNLTQLDGFFGTLKIDNVSVNASPEPTTMVLLGLGLLGLAGIGRKRIQG